MNPGYVYNMDDAEFDSLLRQAEETLVTRGHEIHPILARGKASGKFRLLRASLQSVDTSGDREDWKPSDDLQGVMESILEKAVRLRVPRAEDMMLYVNISQSCLNAWQEGGEYIHDGFLQTSEDLINTVFARENECTTVRLFLPRGTRAVSLREALSRRLETLPDDHPDVVRIYGEQEIVLPRRTILRKGSRTRLEAVVPPMSWPMAN